MRRMTERKPTEMSFASWVDKQILDAQAEGAFDNLPGAGKPLPGLHKPYDENWWIRQKLEREGHDTEALLPEPLRLRREIERLPETVRSMPTEQQVRETVSELNRRVVAWLRSPSGPAVRVRPADTEQIVETWRRQRESRRQAAVEALEAARKTPPRRRRWWFRRR